MPLLFTLLSFLSFQVTFGRKNGGRNSRSSSSEARCSVSVLSSNLEDSTLYLQNIHLKNELLLHKKKLKNDILFCININ